MFVTNYYCPHISQTDMWCFFQQFRRFPFQKVSYEDPFLTTPSLENHNNIQLTHQQYWINTKQPQFWTRCLSLEGTTEINNNQNSISIQSTKKLNQMIENWLKKIIFVLTHFLPIAIIGVKNWCRLVALPWTFLSQLLSHLSKLRQRIHMGKQGGT